MKKDITLAPAVASGVEEAWRDIGASFERFCLTAGIATLADMMERDAADLCGPRYGREDDRRGHRWGQAAGKLGFHGGKVAIERPRVRVPERPRVGVADLGGGAVRGLAGALGGGEGSWFAMESCGGAEPDADQRLDAPVRARRSAA